MSRKQPESLKNVPIRKRGKALTIDEKLMVVRVFDKCNEEKRNGNDIDPKDAYSRTSRYTSVGRRQVVEIIRYFRETGEVSKPAQVGNRSVHITNIPSFSEPYIRNFIFNRHLSGQICNATHVQDFLREHLHREIPKRTIRAHLNRMGFTYSRTKKKSRSLHEKPYIRQQRHSYLHNIKTFRQKNYKPIYIDESFLHHYHGNQFSWFNESYGDYLERPTGKGRRWCFISAMSEVSLITETRKIFEAKKSTGDYHDMFNAPHFLEWWVQKLLPNLSHKCVIIMDRATYHLVSDEQIIPQAMRKSELRNWLTNKHIAWEEEWLKPKLLEEVNNHLDKTPQVQKIAEDNGHAVLLLPVHHPELNPIELIWAIVKNDCGRLLRQGIKFQEVRTHLENAFDKITGETCAGLYKKIQQQEEVYWSTDIELDNTYESNIDFVENDYDTNI